MGPREKIGIAEIVEVINGEAIGRYLEYSNIKIIFQHDILKTSATAKLYNDDSTSGSFEIHVGDLVHFVGELHSDKIYATSATKAANLRSSVRGIISYVGSAFGQLRLLGESVDDDENSPSGFKPMFSHYRTVAFLPYQHVMNVRYIQYRCNEILRVRDEVVVDVVDNVSCKLSRLQYMAIRMEFPKMVYGRHTALTAVDCLGIVVQFDTDRTEMMTLFCNGLSDGTSYVSTAIPKETTATIVSRSKLKIGDRYRFFANRISIDGNWVVKDLQFDPTACVVNQNPDATGLRCWNNPTSKDIPGQMIGEGAMKDKQEPCWNRKRSISVQEVYKGAKVINSQNDQPRNGMLCKSDVVRNQQSSMAAYCGRPRCAKPEAGRIVDGKQDLGTDQSFGREMCKLGHDVEYKGLAKVIHVADHEAVGDLVSDFAGKLIMPLDAFSAASGSRSTPHLTAYLRLDDLVLFIPETKFALQSSQRSSFSAKLAKRVDRKACHVQGTIKKLSTAWGYIFCNCISGFRHHVNLNNHLSFFAADNIENEVFTGLRLSLDKFLRVQDQIRLDSVDQGGQTDHRRGPRWKAIKVYFPVMIYGKVTDRIATNCLGILFAISQIDNKDPGMFQGYLFCKGLGDGGIETRLPTVDHLGNQRLFKIGDRFRFNATRCEETHGPVKWIVSSIEFDPSARILDDDKRPGFLVERGTDVFRSGTGVRRQTELEQIQPRAGPQQNSDTKSSLKIAEREKCKKPNVSLEATPQVLHDESQNHCNPLTTLGSRDRISIARGRRIVTLTAASKTPGSMAVGNDAHKSVNELSSMNGKSVNFSETTELGRGRGKGVLRDDQKSKLLKSSNYAYSVNCLATTTESATCNLDQSYAIEQLRKEINSLKAKMIDVVPPGYVQSVSMIENNNALSSYIAQDSAFNRSCNKLNQTKSFAQSTGNLRLPLTDDTNSLSYDLPIHSLNKSNKVDSIASSSFLDPNILSHAPSAQSILKPSESLETTKHSDYIPSDFQSSEVGVSLKSGIMNIPKSPSRLSINLPESHLFDAMHNPDYLNESEMFTPSQLSSDDTMQNHDIDDCDDNELNLRKLEIASAGLDATNAAGTALGQGNTFYGQEFLSFSDLEEFCSSRNFSSGMQSYGLMKGGRQFEPYLSCPHIPSDSPIVNRWVSPSSAQGTDIQSIYKNDNQVGSSLLAMPCSDTKGVIKEQFEKKLSCDAQKISHKRLLIPSLGNRKNKDTMIKRNGQGATMIKPKNLDAMLKKLENEGATSCNRDCQIEPLSSRQNNRGTFSDQDSRGDISHDGHPNKETAAAAASKDGIDAEIIHAVVQDEFLLDHMFEQYPALMKSFLRAKFKEEKENNASC